MKILFVSGNLCNGGAQRVIAVISSGLANMGHDVSLVLYARNENEYKVSENIKIYSIANSYSDYCKISKFKRILKLRELVKNVNPDVAVGFLEGGYGLYLASIGLGFPKIASARIDPRLIIRNNSFRGHIDNFWFNHADAVVLQSESQLNGITNINWKRKTVIENPINDSVFLYPEHDYDRECANIVMAGRLTEQKNYMMVLQAMKEVHRKWPKVKLNIFGKGDKKKELDEFIVNNGMKEYIFLRGWTNDTLQEFQNGDIFILSSNFEGMPNSLMEAMALGLPCIATDCPTGPSDLIDNGINGFLIPVGDVSALQNKISYLLGENANVRKIIGCSAKQKIFNSYNVEKICKKWENLFANIIK